MANESALTPELLSTLATAPLEDALQILRVRNLVDTTTILTLANLALSDAEAEPAQSKQWLAICRGLNQTEPHPATSAQIAYAQARLDLMAGDLRTAEANILAAQANWAQVDDRASIARSNLGLTQVFAIQGRYEEAETAIKEAIAYFSQALGQDPNDFELIIILVGAQRNLGNLYVYQEMHEAALEQFEKSFTILKQAQSGTEKTSAEHAAFAHERASTALSMSLSLSALDRIREAEATLLSAQSTFGQQSDLLHHGRTLSNLGSLYLRMGRYADAVAAFAQAEQELIGDHATEADIDLETLFGASEMLLEQAMTYLALNLLPETKSSLERCRRLFSSTSAKDDEVGSDEYPHELGGTLYALGQVDARLADWPNAENSLLEAEQIFDRLGNSYWLNRCHIALATLAFLQGDHAKSARQLDALMTEMDSPNHDVERTTTAWDIGSRTELKLLRLRLYVEDGEIESAQLLAEQIEAQIDNLPQLQLRLSHARGQIAYSLGQFDEAREHYLQAIELLERQRAALSIEEIRSAFITDKTDIYADLVLNLFAMVEPKSDDAAIDGAPESVAGAADDTVTATIAEAFAIIERSRSRTLLERLLAALPDDDTDHGTADDALQQSDKEGSRREQLRQELHWLYNRLLGQDGTRRMDVALNQEIQAREKALQMLEWQTSTAFQQVDSVDLVTMQSALSPDQQAVVYYIANDEIMAFVISKTSVKVVRTLCQTTELLSAQRDLRFQLGRFQMGSDYSERHAARLHRGIDAGLSRLYELLVAPLINYITAPRLQIIPFGATHLVPFHALRDEQGYLVEKFEFSYSPSATIAATYQARQTNNDKLNTFAGLAIDDELIPEARSEVELVARHFSTAWTYLDERANRVNLRKAAAQADILHIATHGLYRADNPFFSSLKLADGWIDVREIYRLPLAARLVVLSACESGAGHIQAGDEIIGLARGFLGAGAQTLVVSMWSVHDATAAQQMDTFYTILQQRGPYVRPATALRQSQLEAIKAGSHPYYWAPFVVLG